MTGSADSTTGYTKDLFGMDVSGGGLAATVHPGELELGTGLVAGPYNEATKKLPVAVDPNSLGPRWRTILEDNWQALDAQTFSANQSYALSNGHIWYKENTGAEWQAPRIVEGAGLRFYPTNTAEWLGRSAGLLSTRNADLGLSLPPTTPLRLSVMRGAVLTPYANANRIYAGIEVSPPGGSSPYEEARIIRSDGEDKSANWGRWHATHLTNHAEILVMSETATVAADCARITMPGGILPSGGLVELGTAVDGDWPDPEDWAVRVSWADHGIPQSLNFDSTWSDALTRGRFNSWGLAIMAYHGIASGEPYLTLRRTKLEAYY